MIKKVFGLFGLLASASVLVSSTAYADYASNQAIWLQQFSNIQPISSNTSQAYCISHTPNSFKASIDTVTNQGINAANGVAVTYSSYKGVSYDNVYFTFVKAKISGQDQNGSWSDKMKLYEQSLTATGNTAGVWSTSKCRGTFNGQIVGQASS
jgi:hypothetical protein